MNGTKHIRSFSLKHLVFAFFLLSLFFPLIQQHLKLIKEKPLQGFFNVEDYPALSIDKWESGEFQKQFEAASNDQIGFHDFFIELQSQINYSIFNISKIQSVVVGKEGYLYVRNYIDAVNGNDFMGSDYINLQIDKAKVVDSVLRQKNITLIFAIAPGKGSYYPEYIPDAYKTNKHPDSTNYECYKNRFKNSNLNFIDLRDYLLKIKDTTRYPLFSQIGVHWNDYACYLAIDTINRSIENICGKQLNKTHLIRLVEEDKLLERDTDAGLLMNTFYLPKHYNLFRPKIEYHYDASNFKPKILAVSDSYFSCLFAAVNIDSCYTNAEYWNYNKDPKSKKILNGNQLKTELEKNNVILLLATDATLNQFPYHFIDNSYEIYAPKNAAYYKLKQREFICFSKITLNNISKNKQWKKMLLKQAKKKGIRPEEEYVNNAIWLYHNQ